MNHAALADQDRPGDEEHDQFLDVDASFRRALADVADLLIPAGNGFPSASEAGVAETGLDLVLAARPDLKSELVRMVRSAAGRTPAELRSANAADFDLVSLAVVTAYFMSPAVRARYGYFGNLPTVPDGSIPGAPGSDDAEAMIQSVREGWSRPG